MTRREWTVMAGAMVRVLGDSSRTHDIHMIEDISSRNRFRTLFEQELASNPDCEVLRQRPELDERTMDLAAFRKLDASTLGGAYIRHLDGNGLSVYDDPLSFEFVSNPDVRYLIHRYRQTHDIWHTLLGLGALGHEEVLVHAFTLGHLRIPISALIVGFGTIKHLLLEARWAAMGHGVLDMYRSGRNAAPLLTVPWEQLWERPLVELRRTYNIHPYSNGRANS